MTDFETRISDLEKRAKEQTRKLTGLCQSLLDHQDHDTANRVRLDDRINVLVKRVDGLAEVLEDMDDAIEAQTILRDEDGVTTLDEVRRKLGLDDPSPTVDGRVVVSAAQVERWERIERVARRVSAAIAVSRADEQGYARVPADFVVDLREALR